MMMDFQQMEQPYGEMMGGGLPALNAPMAPMAQQVQSQGRDEDTMLVHMTPNEVNSLQGLAMAHGGSLTINPETGLPEAGFLKKLLPTLLGAGLMFIPGVNALAAAGMVAAGSVAKTGSLKKGLMAGLQAYGGASLAGGLGAGNVFGAAKQAASTTAGVGTTAGTTAGAGSSVTSGLTPTLSLPPVEGAIRVTGDLAGAASAGAGQVAKTGLAGVAQGFGDAAKAGLPGGIIGKAAPRIAAMGLMQGVSGAMTPSGGGSVAPDGRIDNSFQGPYYAQDRQQIMNLGDPTSSKQRRHFAIGMPEIYNTMGQVVQPGSHTTRGTQIMQPVLNPSAKKAKDDKGKPMYSFVPTTYMGGIDPPQGMVAPNQDDMYDYTGYAGGGEVQIADGGFIVDARSVAEGGGGYTEAGFEEFKKLGGVPIKGPGNGVSDSIPARIGGTQPARVAAGEVYMSPEAVRRIGKGDPKRGANKLYAMMNEAHKATKRGQERNILKGLA